MADERTLARRYARALLDVAKEKADIPPGVGGEGRAPEARRLGGVERVAEDLHGVAALWNDSRELRVLMSHPSIPRSEKRRALAAALRGRVDDLTLRFVDLLI